MLLGERLEHLRRVSNTATEGSKSTAAGGCVYLDSNHRTWSAEMPALGIEVRVSRFVLGYSK